MTQLHHVQVRPRRVTRHISPTSLADVLEILAEHGGRARPIAGGTDLLLELARNARPDVDVLVDLSRVADSQTIQVVDGRVVIPMSTTHADVVASDAIRSAGLPLAQACLEIGSPQLRNRATVVGNVVTASPANDTISALVALDAELTIANTRGARTVAMSEFFTGFRATVLEPDELVTSISFDALTDQRRGVFVKLGNRSAQAISVVHAAVVVELDASGTVSDLRVALGSVAATVTDVEGALDIAHGRTIADCSADVAQHAAAGVTPIDDVRATADYRSNVVSVVVRRALAALDAGAEHDAWLDDPPLLRNTDGASMLEAVDAGVDDEIRCAINGRSTTAADAVGSTLLEWIRDHVGLTGTKEGCAEGECGACTIHMDGRAVLACLVPAAEAQGRSITTIEGLAEGDRLHPVQTAFDECGGVQCGFCTPGFVMSAAALAAEKPDATRDDIEHALAGNLCRCTGYYRIIEAVSSVDIGGSR